MSVPTRLTDRLPTTYGWTGDGKTAAEISEDIRQTRYRLDADVHALRAKFRLKRFVPVIAAVGLAAAALIVRRFRR